MDSYRSLKTLCLLLIASLCYFGTEARAGLKIYYIRHAEAGHNVKKYWKDISERDWPSFVGDQEAFTPRGLEQIEDATRKLRDYDFDLITSSPMWRARNTILPYLKKSESRCEIWPELRETYVSSLILSPDLVAPKEPILNQGDAIEIPKKEARYFFLREEGLKKFELPEYPDDHSEKLAETGAAKVVLDAAIAQIKERFSGSEKSILLAGHGSSGLGLLRLLVQDRLKDYPSIENASLWMVEEQEDGSFKLRMFNDVPLDRN